MKYLANLTVCAMALAAIGCSSDSTAAGEPVKPSSEQTEPESGREDGQDTGNTAEDDGALLELHTGNVSVADEAYSSGRIRLTARGAWSADMSGAGWLEVSPAAGEAGEFELTLTALADNPAGDERTARIAVSCGSERRQLTVIQSGRNLSGEFDRDFLEMLVQRGCLPSSSRVTPEDVRQVTAIAVFGNYSYPEKRYLGNLTSLRGIELFTELTELSCWGNALTTLDLSGNTKLRKLLCYNNALTHIDIRSCPELIVLTCHSNRLAELDVTHNPKLKDAIVCANGLQTLDISANGDLRTLFCENNLLTGLDMNRNPHLRHLRCFNNPGRDGVFRIMAQFDNGSIPEWADPVGHHDSIPAHFTTKPWTVGGATVTPDYVKAY